MLMDRRHSRLAAGLQTELRAWEVVRAFVRSSGLAESGPRLTEGPGVAGWVLGKVVVHAKSRLL